MRKYGRNPVFLASFFIVVSLIVLGASFPDAFGNVAGLLFDATTNNFGWFFLLAIFVLIVFLVGVALSSYGSVRLGGPSERPEFSFFAWIGMLFSTGFGSGLVFWGVAEPMSHFFSVPFPNMESGTDEAARTAMSYAFFHQGISQWSVFAVMGLAIGLLQFKKSRDGLVSTALEPVVGSHPFVKHSVDTLAIVSTVMGVATSIGLGILQMNGGLNIAFGVPQSTLVQVVLIVLMGAAFLLSTTTGLKKGIRILSSLNLGLALGLLLFVFFAGPTLFIVESFTLAIGDVINSFVSYSLRLEPYIGGTWVKDWTIFYWAWAIAWSPFVGAFVARVSKGRTVREFIIGVMLIPPLIAMTWIAVFGGTALWSDLYAGTNIAQAVDLDLTQALFVTFEQLPLTPLLNAFAIALIFIFLVTSADSATYILASMTSKGSIHPPLFLKIVWGVLISGTAAVLLYTGGLSALQTASLVSALPFTVVLVLLMFAITKTLRDEVRPVTERDIRRFKRIQEKVDDETE